MSLEDLQADDFAQCVDQKFLIHVEGSEPLEAQLIEVRGLGASDENLERRSPFSLIFRGPPDLSLEQGIFKVENASLGELDLFIVTIGPDDEGMRHEVIFN